MANLNLTILLVLVAGLSYVIRKREKDEGTLVTETSF